MAAIAEKPCASTLYIPAGFGSEVRPDPQGEAGKGLRRKAQAMSRQWAERAEILNASSGLVTTGGDSGTLPYYSVPPNRVFYVKTRYVFLGKGEPMPFELDDE